MDWSATIDEHKRRQMMHIGKVAAELVLQRGIASVTMSALAKASGVSRATLYNYVPSVEASIQEYIRAQSIEFFRQVEAAVSAEDNVVDKLRRYVAAQVNYVVSPDHALAAALMDVGLRPSPAHSGEAPALLRSILAEGIREGLVDDVLGEDGLALLVSRMLVSAHELHTSLGMSGPDLCDGLISIILNAVLKPGAHQSMPCA